ncbi:CrcB family protein [Microbacterium sp. NPDC096154]|uniref:CrcB family protein n=1 Tax=Microbacterium sp. NPDC096154 TaxID=3155549 RepID=UPI00331763EC
MGLAPIRWGLLPLVVAGGVVGVALRQALLLPFAGGFSFGALAATAAVNAAGSGLLGFVVGRVADRSPRRRAFLGAGVLGGFTTYSGFAVMLAQLTGAGLVVHAVLAAGVGLLAASVAAIAGLRAGGAAARRARDGAPR